MANIIAIIWDFDKTLIREYMQTPLFVEYGVDGPAFWAESDSLPAKYSREQGIRVNADTIYLNLLIRYAKSGKVPGLNNEKLREFGKRLDFYDGVPEIFEKTRALIEDDPEFSSHDIRVEHYIVSTGLSQIIRGSVVRPYVKNIWGCEFIEEETGNGSVISEVGYTIDNTTKTRALFEINKGVGILEDVDVNTQLPEEMRRVHFKNMVYVADGPSDIPAFSVVNQHGGATFAVYPKGDMRALEQVETMRKTGRINMFAEADYTETSTAYMWLCHKIKEFAKRIVSEEKDKLAEYTSSGTPKHLST